LLQKEEQLRERNERAKQKLEQNRQRLVHDIERSDLADTIQRQKMKVDYLETLCQSTTQSSSEHTRYSVQLEEAREYYLNLLS
jgi:SLT domain-containing protein